MIAVYPKMRSYELKGRPNCTMVRAACELRGNVGWPMRSDDAGVRRINDNPTQCPKLYRFIEVMKRYIRIRLSQLSL